MNNLFLYFVTWIKKQIIRGASMFIRSSKQKRKKSRKEWTTKVEKDYLRRYLPVLSHIDATKSVAEEPLKKLWVCWLQGEDNAPEIVKCCIKNMRKYAAEYEVVVVTNENLRDFISLPKYVYEKNAKGIIPNAQFADIVRVSLLAEKGGIWIDSTVLLTDNLPKAITKSPFFAMHSDNHLKNNNWILASAPQQWLIVAIRDLLLEYWKYENRMINYFMYHILFDLMIEENLKAAEEWKKVPIIYDYQCYDLEKNLLSPYHLSLWQEILEKTGIHKLNYKYNKNQSLKGTFVEKILSNSWENGSDADC